MKHHQDLALTNFAEGQNCAQAVLLAFQPGTGLSRESLLAAAVALGGGIARSGEICGAANGAVMAIGLHFPELAGDVARQRETVYPLAGQVLQAFGQTTGALRCRDLLDGCDLSTPAGQERFKNEGLRSKVCEVCVREAARLTAETLVAAGKL